MSLAIFDLDETLIAADSASLFAQYLSDKDLVAADFVSEDAKYMQAYNGGCLDIHEYMRFFCGALSAYRTHDIDALLAEFIEQYIQPLIYPEARLLLKQLQQQQRRILIISATAEFIVAAIAKHLGVSDYLAIQLATQSDKAGRLSYSGAIKGTPSFREGKVKRLFAWLDLQQESLADAHFYSDSINDLPLLQLVDYPVATNPDLKLQTMAEQHGWKLIYWKKP